MPERFRKRALRDVTALANRYGIPEPSQMLDAWVHECATTHYRIFFEYRLYLGKETGADYMPAVTRSSLRFLTQSSNANVANLVLPFVALKAVEKVNRRCDLIPRVVEWTTGPGREVVEGLAYLESVVRSTRDPEEERRILSTVEGLLSSEYSRKISITLDLVKVGLSAFHGKAELEAAKDALRLARSNTFQWLWSIRNPEVKFQWLKWVQHLAKSHD